MSRILKDFLSAAGVAYTNLHADNIFYASPNRRSLLGLKQMLAHYGIATLGVRVSDGDVEDLTFPCILHVKDDFLVATGYEPTHIIYRENGKRMLKSSESLLNEWDGYALLMTEKPTSTCEPDYEKHVHEERMEKIPWWSLAIVMAGILVFGCISQKDYAHSIMSLLSAAGFAVSFFLAEKEIKGKSRVGDQLCLWLGEGKCGDKKNAGFIWGDLALCEVGLGYFSAQIVALSVIPDAQTAVAAIGIAALLFCPWSILTQWKMKQWCGLCLLIVAILVLQGAASFYLLDVPRTNTGASVVLLMAMGVVLAHCVVRSQRQKTEARRKVWDFKAFRNQKAIIRSALRYSKLRTIEERDVARREGNLEAEHQITLVTSNNCPYCTKMMPRIEKLKEKMQDTWLFEYINLSDMTPEHLHEFILRTGIHATPTILVDDHDLPEVYEVEDILYNI